MFSKINIVRKGCDAVLGKGHPEGIRIGFGVVVMAVGVVISKVHVDFFGAHYFFDLFGYLVHGIGAVPVVEWLFASEAVEDVALVFPMLAASDEEEG
jgi:hypothetical protein